MFLRRTWRPVTPIRMVRSQDGARKGPLDSSVPVGYSCSTQHVIALSSEEAELFATGRAPAGRLQWVQLPVQAGLKVKLEMLTDSTANVGMHCRCESGRVRHLDVRWLWAQEAVQVERFALKKVGTNENVSD